MQIFDYNYTFFNIVDSQEHHSSVFERAFMYIVNYYVYLLSMMAIIYFGEMLEWLCKGCKFDPNSDNDQGMVARTFDPFKFKEHTECSICLCDFEEDSLVTVLPCDVRHYFHAECIQSWSEQQNTCPLCKAVFTMAEIRDANKRLTNKIEEM